MARGATSPMYVGIAHAGRSACGWYGGSVNKPMCHEGAARCAPAGSRGDGGYWGWQVFLSSWEASGSFWVGAVRRPLNAGKRRRFFRAPRRTGLYRRESDLVHPSR